MSIPTNTIGTISQAPFGNTPDGTPVEIYTLRNGKGMEARILTYGGIVQSLKVPDKNGQFDDVVLGYDNLEGYLTNNSPYFGALIGRYGNRIGGAKFTLGRQNLYLGRQQRPQFAAWRRQGFRQGCLAGARRWLSPDGPRWS